MVSHPAGSGTAQVTISWYTGVILHSGSDTVDGNIPAPKN